MTVTTAPRTSVAPGEPAARHGRVWPALARHEARSTLRHPLIWIGVAACLYLLWSFNRDHLPHLGGYSTYVGLGLAPLSGAALLVAHLQTSRAQRHGTLEIEQPAPAALRARTLGHLLGSLSVVAVAVVIIVGYMVYLYLLGGAGSPNLGELLIGPLVVGIAALAGVAAGTWLPNRFGGLIGLGLIAAVQIALQDAPATRHWFSWWHTVLWYGEPDLWIRPTWAHVVYLLGAAGLVAAFASLRHGVRIVSAGTAALGLVLLISGGVAQARPPSTAAVDRIWARVTDPASHRVTIERNGVTYNVFPTYERWIDWWDGTIGKVIEPIPSTSRPAIVVEQAHRPYPSQLLDEFVTGSPVRTSLMNRAEQFDSPLPPGDPWPIEVTGSIYLPSRSSLTVATAVRAVGLPLVPIEVQAATDVTKSPGSAPEPDPSGDTTTIAKGSDAATTGPVPQPITVGCSAEGQAREVVAAWLAAQADSALAGRYRDVRRHGPAARDSYTGQAFTQYAMDEPAVNAILWQELGWTQTFNMYGGGTIGGVEGSPTATDLAAQLLDMPPTQVATAIQAHWDEWTDPTTSIQAIIDAFDLEPPPTPAQWVERGDGDPADYTESIAAYPLWLGDAALLGDQPYPTCP